MKIERVRLDKYEGPDEEDITIGKTYEVLRGIQEDDGEYVILDDSRQQHVVDPCWCTVIQDEFGDRMISKESVQWSGKGNLPIGAHVKYNNNEWEVCGINNDEIWLRTLDKFKMNVVFKIGRSVFLPIKSEKDKEIDKIASELLESVNKNGDDFVYQEWVMAEHLYNAGLRFTKDSK